jgi:hypothetical protein
MTSRYLKQIAYNERVLQAEDEIAVINCDIAHFLSEMSFSETITMCINSGAQMKKNEATIGGLLWMQEDRVITAANGIMDGMPNTRESVILAGVAEAVEWSHAIEHRSDTGKRVTQRVIIYPAEIPPLDEVLSDFCRDPSEKEDGSHIALTKIVTNAAQYESPPRFIHEDSSEVLENPVLAASVPGWMNADTQVSVGTRPLVLEDGPDTKHPSDEDATEEEHGDKLTGVYANGLKSLVYLSRSEVSRQKAVASYAKTVGYGKWINSDAPSSTDASSDFESSQPQSVPTSPSVPYRSESRNPFLPSSDTRASSDAFSQSAPSSTANTRCGSRFNTPDQTAPSQTEAPPVPKTQKKKVIQPPQSSTPTPAAADLPKKSVRKGAGKKAANATPVAVPA